MGTFKGYGAYVGVNPYKELPEGVAPNKLGKTVLKLLEQSGPTGYKIDDADKYERATANAETARILKEHFPAGKATTGYVARRFERCRVRHKDKQKSVSIQTYRFDSAKRWDAADEHVRRVNISDGPGALGDAILEPGSDPIFETHSGRSRWRGRLGIRWTF